MLRRSESVDFLSIGIFVKLSLNQIIDGMKLVIVFFQPFTLHFTIGTTKTSYSIFYLWKCELESHNLAVFV
jgi:hypothetical protein